MFFYTISLRIKRFISQIINIIALFANSYQPMACMDVKNYFYNRKDGLKIDFLELAKKRYAVRKYESRPVEEDKMLKILEAGRVAPTAVNYQPQRIIVLTKKDSLDKLKKAANAYDAPLVFIVCVDHNAAWRRPIDGKNTVDIDASIVTDHMMLQATELGLGSVWICYFKTDVLRKEFNIPDHVEPVNILAVGYAAGEILSPERHDTKRKPLNDTVFFETF